MIQAYFSNIRDIILNEIHNSKRDISIAVAWFTQRDLFNAIIGAIDRGVNVSLILINDIINRNEYGLDFSLYLQKGVNYVLLIAKSSNAQQVLFIRWSSFNNRIV